MKMFRKDEGFTLVELMVVVLIIGILVAIAIPVFNAAKANAQKKSCFANQRTHRGQRPDLPRRERRAAADVAACCVPTFIKVAPICPTSQLGYAIDASGTVTGDSGASAGWSTVGGTAHTHF